MTICLTFLWNCPLKPGWLIGGCASDYNDCPTPSKLPPYSVTQKCGMGVSESIMNQ